MIPGVRLARRPLGTRRVFFSAILVFAVGSLLCANAQTLTQLVVFRVVQGVGGAMLLPVGRLAVLRVVSGASAICRRCRSSRFPG